jgi:hypothetical protein
MFKNNIFTFNRKFYIQRSGLAMGSSCGPMVANLYLYILEKKWIHIHRHLIYKRFIDDIFLVLKEELNFSEFEKQFIYLKLSKSEGSYFYDVNLSKRKKRYCESSVPGA